MNKYYRIALMATMMGATALPALAQTTPAPAQGATPAATASKDAAPVKKSVHRTHHAKVAPKVVAKG